MLKTKFQASEPSSSEAEDFFFHLFLCISMVRTWDSLAWGYFGPWGLGLNKLGKGPLGNAKYLISSKHLKQVVLKKKIFEYISHISMI